MLGDNGIEQNKRKFLEVIKGYQNLYDLWGHGVTGQSVADSVLDKGLETRWRSLNDIAHKIPEEEKLLLDQISHWPYEARRFIVIIVSPKGLDFTDYGGSAVREQSVANSNLHIFVNSGSNRTVPSEKILGYVDVGTFNFVENPAFKK
jgi:hypothetical protein